MKGGGLMADKNMREIRICIPEEMFSLFLPQKTISHFMQARKEVLLGIRAMIDAKIESLDIKETQKTRKKTKIKVN